MDIFWWNQICHMVWQRIPCLPLKLRHSEILGRHGWFRGTKQDIWSGGLQPAIYMIEWWPWLSGPANMVRRGVKVGGCIQVVKTEKVICTNPGRLNVIPRVFKRALSGEGLSLEPPLKMEEDSQEAKNAGDLERTRKCILPWRLQKQHSSFSYIYFWLCKGFL